jgi:hypothetical protein
MAICAGLYAYGWLFNEIGHSSISADRDTTLQRLEYVLDDITVHQLPHMDL